MKIKCPLCHKELISEYNEDELVCHIIDSHNMSRGQRVTKSYVKLLFKIHEKIESLEKPVPKDYKPMFSQEFIFTDIILQELKSLLEK